MKVWIDQDLCTGDGLCEEIAPDVFVLLDDGLAYVREGDKIFAEEKGNPQGAQGLAVVPAGQEDITIESAEECPGECIFIEPGGPAGPAPSYGCWPLAFNERPRTSGTHTPAEATSQRPMANSRRAPARLSRSGGR